MRHNPLRGKPDISEAWGDGPPRGERGACHGAGHGIKEKRDGYIEHCGDALQPAGTNAVSAALVLLNLLEGYPDPICEFSLR
jgi:hypothetical protein